MTRIRDSRQQRGATVATDNVAVEPAIDDDNDDDHGTTVPQRLVEICGDLSVEQLAEHLFVLLFSDYVWTTRNADNVGTLSDFRGKMATLLNEAQRFNDEDCSSVHVLQVRSVPVSDFFYLLRHYFIRIDEIIDVHPGNEQRVCLRGWYEATDIGSDRLEAQYYLCRSCLDTAVKQLWITARRFSFVFSNCDHSCNRSRQSIGIAMTIFVMITATVAFLLDGAVIIFVLSILAIAASFGIIYASQTTTSMLVLRYLGYNPSVSCVGIKLYACVHLSDNRLEIARRV